MTAFYGVLCFCGLCQLVMCVTTAVFSCRAVCCRSGKTTGAVVYNANGAEAAATEEGGAASNGSAGVAPTQIRAALLPSGTVPVPVGGSAQVKAGEDGFWLGLIYSTGI